MANKQNILICVKNIFTEGSQKFSDTIAIFNTSEQSSAFNHEDGSPQTLKTFTWLTG
jgi:hypothetical protein